MLSKREMKSIILNKVVVEPDRKRLEKILNFAKRTWLKTGRGGIFVISGEYGTGKTTLLNAMMEICNPQSTVFVDDGSSIGKPLMYCRFLVVVGYFVEAIEMPRLDNITSMNLKTAVYTGK
jgi:ABC-type cobalamin/Fe3+-siderophores transport system ATPase subunit